MCPNFILEQSTEAKLFILKTKQGTVLTSQYQNELFTLNMFSKNKQNKLKQTKKDEIKEESQLNCTTIIKYAFCFLVFLFFII